MNVYPTMFEATDEASDLLFTVVLFDEVTAKVNIKTVVDLSTWNKIAAEVAVCLEQMKL